MEQSKNKQEDKRIALEKDTVICLHSQSNENVSADFKILGVVGTGGSSICYDAECNGIVGRLKEYYPHEREETGEYHNFRRTANHQLIAVGDAQKERFQQSQTELIKTYEKLENAKKNHAVLNNYVPFHMIFVGYPNYDERDQNRNIYIWTPSDKIGKTFEEYLNDIYRNPKQNSAQKLYDILQIMITLAEGICAFHKSNLLHLDINPFNFLVLEKGNGEIDPTSISMFDVNSIYQSDDPSLKTIYIGTKGFIATEMKKTHKQISTYADIYSIGATLYYAITEKSYYDDTDYEKISVRISESALFTDSEITSNIRIRSRLTTILQKSLKREPKKRYSNCDTLIPALKEVRDHLKLLIPNLLGSQYKITVETQEKRVNSTAILQNLLYKKPLYAYIPNQETDMHILIVGMDDYARKFLDLCLQAGQMKDRQIFVTAISEEAMENKASYLQDRPSFTRFFTVSGEYKPKHSYGAVNFEQIDHLEGQNTEQQTSIIQQFLNKSKRNGELFQYIFISLGNDTLNYNVAKIYKRLLKQEDRENHISFVWTGVHDEKIFREINPVYVNDDISVHAIDPQLERMAYNVHSIWKQGSGGGTFKERYNYISSIAFALSIPYKLNSVGIAVKQENKTWRETAAKEFAETILDNIPSDWNISDTDIAAKDAKEKLNQLVALEHRRWVVEKVTGGWSAPLKEDGIIDFTYILEHASVKNNRDRMHPCILHCDANAPLSEKEYRKNRRKWDEPINSAMDDLDRFSLELHQFFKETAKKRKESGSLQNILSALKEHLALLPEDNAVLIRAYSEYLFCIRNILEEKHAYSKRYNVFKKALEKALKTIETGAFKNVHDTITSAVQQMDWEIFPLLECNMFRDYKSYDSDLIHYLPFILTYHNRPRLTMVFDDGRYANAQNDVVFRNAASASILNPSKIHYLYYYNADTNPNGNTNIAQLVGKIKSVLNFFITRKAEWTCSFTIAIHKNRSSVEEVLKEKLRALQQDFPILERIETKICADEMQAVQTLLTAAGKRKHTTDPKRNLFDLSTSLFAAEQKKENDTFIAMVKKIRYSCFTFQWQQNRFLNYSGCETLQYVPCKPFLRIEEMFALRNTKNEKLYIPEFAEDYLTLWNIYTGESYLAKPVAEKYGVQNWTSMCNTLKTYVEGHDQITAFELKNENKNTAIEEMTFLLPGFCYATARYLLEKLKEYRIVSTASSLYCYASDTCKLNIKTMWKLKDTLNTVFENPYLLMNANSFRIECFPHFNTEKVVFQYNKLDVCNLKMDSYSTKILLTLSNEGYINCFTVGSDSVSFVFSSERIKKLLTTAGEILEIYTYYEALKTNYFDDVACGYEFLWEADGVRSEIDGILTKGFQSIILECKSQTKLDQNYYYKLMGLSEQFGINVKRVLIANHYNHHTEADTINQIQYRRGSQMDIITISDIEEIKEIGETLKKIMEGTYIPRH